jgi:hypothetical protein
VQGLAQQDQFGEVNIMANYFSKYQGRGGPAIAPGIVQMMGSIGDEYAKGIEGLAEGIEKHRQNKEKREILTERGEWVANQKMQDLAAWIEEDPQRVDTKEHDEKLKDIQKFGEGIADMPLGKLESAISNYALDREIEDRRQTREVEKAKVEESRRRFNVEQEATQNYRNTQTGFTKRAEERTIADRKEARGKEDAGRKVHQAFAAIPTQTETSRAGYFEEREIPEAPAGTTPTKNYDSSEARIGDAVSIINDTIKSKQKALGKFEDELAYMKKHNTSEVVYDGGVSKTVFTGDQGVLTATGNAKSRLEKDISALEMDKEYLDKDSPIQTSDEDRQEILNRYVKPLEPMQVGADVGEAPATLTEYIWNPPSKGTRPTTQIERHRKMQKILADHGGDLGMDELGKFRKEMGKLDPNQPSPFRYEKGPNETWLATHQGTGATVNLGQEGHMSATEKGYIHRRAENQLKRLDKAKEAAEAARTRFENAVAGGISSEAELKALQAQLDRAQSALEQEQPILEYGPNGWKN